jgi:HlyD family secretion protein
MRKTVTIVVVLIIIACVALPFVIGPLAGITPGSMPGAQNKQAALRTAIIDKGDLILTVSATGSTVARRQAQISFDQAGRVQEVLVQEGQTVQAGQLLARLDDSTQQANLQQADYALKAAQAALDKLLRPVDAGDLANAEADVKSAQGQYSAIAGAVSLEQIKAYEVQYQQAQAAAKNAEALRIEAGGRYAQDDPNYQRYLAQVGTATFNAEIARLRLEQAKAGRSLVVATANIAYYQARLAQVKAGSKQADIDDAQAQLAIAQLQRDQTQHQLDKTRLLAPFAGVLIAVNVKAGEVKSGPVMVIMDNSEIYVDVKVDESDIGKIRVGQPIEFTLDALPDTTLTGKVQRIADMADASASVITYLVRVTLDPTSAPVKVGMTANASFLVTELRNVTRVPNLFLKFNRSTGQTTVNLANADGSFTEVPVKLGVQGSDASEVIEGLYEGDTVALLAGSASR